MEKVLSKFEVRYLQVLDENGKVDSKLMPKLSDSMIKQMYESMILTRVFDAKALKLQRQGRIGTYASTLGQEAQVAAAFATGKKDFIFPAFRENGVYLARGMPPEMIYHYWAGDERGSAIPENVGMFTISITVGAHPLHAVGYAMGNKIQKKKDAVLTFFGDGATSEGDCLEAMNFAGVYGAQVVFICQNNQWAISLPVSRQTAAETIAQKSIAFGIESIRVDGNDVFAVYSAVSDAIKKAKSGKPVLVEMLTYRMGDHTTSDEAKKYRKESELSVWAKKDPILRLKRYMTNKKMFSAKYEKDVLAKAEKQIDEAVQKFESHPAYKPEEIFNYMYKEMTPELKEQQAALLKELENEPQAEKSTGKAEVKEKGMGVVGELEEAE